MQVDKDERTIGQADKKRIVIGVDPGRAKCGVAAVGEDGTVLWSKIVTTDEVGKCIAELLARFKVSAIVIGGGTGSKHLLKHLAEYGIDENLIAVMDERFTTLEARRRYFKEHPPKGWRRLVPISLQTPPEPYDDYVAILLAERHLMTKSKTG